MLTNGNAAKDASSKLSKIGRRIRDSCRQHLRGKHLSGGASSAPEDYGSIPATNVSIPTKGCFFSESMMYFSHCPKNVPTTIQNKLF